MAENQIDFIDPDIETTPQQTQAEPVAEIPVTPVPVTREKADNGELSRLLELSRENILQGLIFSEILGKPRCKRRFSR